MTIRPLALSLQALIVSASVSAVRPAAADVMAECIAEYEHSLDLRKEGKLLDARRELAACSAAPCPEAIQQACRSRINDLNATIPTVVFEVKDAARQDVLDAPLSIDGQAEGSVGVAARALDPGRHVVRVELPGRPAIEKAIVVREGERDRREEIALVPAPASPVLPAPSPAPAKPPVRDGAPLSSSGTVQRTAGWVVGGAGAVAMAVGGALGLVALASYDGAPGCSRYACSSQDSVNTRNTARYTGDAATVVFVAGAAATVVGIVLWAAAPSGRQAAAGARWQVGFTPGGLAAEGRF